MIATPIRVGMPGPDIACTVHVEFTPNGRVYSYHSPVVHNVGDLAYAKVGTTVKTVRVVRVVPTERHAAFKQLFTPKSLDPISGTWKDPVTWGRGSCSIAASAQPAQPAQPENKAMSIEITKQTLINGAPVEQLSDAKLYAMIAQAEKEIATLSAIQNKPKRLIKEIEIKIKQLHDLVDLLDAQDAAAAKA